MDGIICFQILGIPPIPSQKYYVTLECLTDAISLNKQLYMCVVILDYTIFIQIYLFWILCLCAIKLLSSTYKQTYLWQDFILPSKQNGLIIQNVFIALSLFLYLRQRWSLTFIRQCLCIKTTEISPTSIKPDFIVHIRLKYCFFS